MAATPPTSVNNRQTIPEEGFKESGGRYSGKTGDNPPKPRTERGKRASLEDRKKKILQNKEDKWVRKTENRRTERCNKGTEGKRKYRRSRKWKAVARNREGSIAKQRKRGKSLDRDLQCSESGGRN